MWRRDDRSGAQGGADQAAPRARSCPPVWSAALVLVALYLGYLSRSAANPELLQIGAGLALGTAVAVLLTTVLRRR